MARYAGYIMVLVLWAVILTPVVIGVVRFFRTTRWSDLVPRITRVPAHPGVRVVSTERALMDPAQWEPLSPWAWRRKR